MNNSLLKKLAIFVPVITLWIVIGMYVFKPSITDRYFVDPVGISKYTDRNNSITPKSMTLLVPIEIGKHRFAIPAGYLSRIGVWNPQTKSYGGQVFMAVNGKDFGAMPGANADSELESLTVWLEEPEKPFVSPVLKLPPPKVLPATVAEFEAGVARDPNYWLRGGMERAADLDRYGLIAYRDKFWGETYVGARPNGDVLVTHCKSPLQKDDLICEVFDARYPLEGVNLKYAYPKTYLREWKRYDASMHKLMASFQRK